MCGPAVLLAVVAATTGCVQPRLASPLEYHSQKGRATAVVRVENRSASPITVRTQYGRLARVEVGETVCIPIPGETGHMRLIFDIDQRRYTSEAFFPLEGSAGWAVEIGHAPAIGIWSLVPAPRCRV